jgi:hypothetical protein
MALNIVRVNPLEYEAGLKALMTSHDVSSFPQFFDHGYASAVRDGARSWIGLDDGGTLQMNITLFVHQFDFDGRRVTGGMLGNMMVATEYRTFFPAIALLKRVVSDAREQGGIDFLYGDPGPKGAQAIFQGARMRQVGNLDRFVIPMRDARWHRHIAATAYVAGLRFRTLRGGAHERCVAVRESDVASVAQPLGPADRLQPLHSVEMYRRRLPGWPAADDYMVELRTESGDTLPGAVALFRGPRERGVVSIYVLRRQPNVSVKSLVPSLIRVARRLGGARLQIEAVQETQLARQLIAGGFTSRADLVPIFAAGFTPLGEEVIKSVDRWEMTGVDMER